MCQFVVGVALFVIGSFPKALKTTKTDRKIQTFTSIVQYRVRRAAFRSNFLRTLKRWQQWWLDNFVRGSFWKAARARFMPLVCEQRLPLSLHADNLGVLIEKEPTFGGAPSYASVVRFMKVHGLIKRPRRGPLHSREPATGIEPVTC